jgi:hypothetical protein
LLWVQVQVQHQQLGTVTFTGASSVSLNGVFSSTYDNYRIVFTTTTISNIFMRLRVSNADETTSQYVYVVQGFSLRLQLTNKGKTMPNAPIDITPAGSAVPVYLEEPTDTELLNVKQNTKQVKQPRLHAKQFVNPL